MDGYTSLIIFHVRGKQVLQLLHIHVFHMDGDFVNDHHGSLMYERGYETSMGSDFVHMEGKRHGLGQKTLKQF